MGKRLISFYFASIGFREAGVLAGALLTSGFVAAHTRRRDLEAAVRQHFQSAQVFAFTSGRGALAACLSAAGVGPGDDVLLSSFTCLAVPTAVIAVGARPVYADINPRSLNVTLATVTAAFSPRVRAVVVQHTLGCVTEIEEIVSAARQCGILVIEDCCLAIGSRKEQTPLGSFADASIFSMELSKTISTGWGGVLIVNDPTLAIRVGEHYESVPEPSVSPMTRMALQAAISGLCYKPHLYPVGKYVVWAAFKVGLFGRSTPTREFEGRVAGDFITKLGGVQAKLGALQWRQLPAVAAACRENGSRLRGILKELGLLPLGVPSVNDELVAPRVSFLVVDRQVTMDWFDNAGIELGAWFDGPLSPLPESRVFNYDAGEYPHAAFVARHVVNLPCHNRLSPKDLSHIEETLKRYAAAHPEDRALSGSLMAAEQGVECFTPDRSLGDR